MGKIKNNNQEKKLGESRRWMRETDGENLSPKAKSVTWAAISQDNPLFFFLFFSIFIYLFIYDEYYDINPESFSISNEV